LDLSEYWKNRGPRYYHKFQNQPKYERNRLKSQEKCVLKLLQGYRFKSILESGCGFGRYTKILFSFFKPDNYVAIDISPEQIRNAKKYLGNDKVKFHCTRIQDFQSDDRFELIFSAENLMHVGFDDITDVIAKMVSLSTRKIISVDWYNQKCFGKALNGYVFMHDYKTLFEKNKIKRIKIHVLPLPLSSKIVSIYAKVRGRHGIEKQAIIEVDV